jgi:hypothetical protein
MPRKTRKSKKQKVVNMIGCSKTHKHKKSCKRSISNLGSKCPKCGVNCRCGSTCNCPKPCPGNCYLNRRVKRGGGGCGSCGCPIPPLSWSQMNQFGGFPLNSVPEATVPLNYGPILGATGQNGGNCGSGMCSVSSMQSGGNCGSGMYSVSSMNGGSNFYKPPSLVPGPIVGSPWGADISKWPSMDGIGGDRNNFLPYNLNKDPALQMSMNDAGYNTLNSKVGGKSKKHRKYKGKRGGGLIPQDLVNLGRDVGFNLKSAYNALNGYSAPVNPLPYKDQLSNVTNTNNLL